VSERALATIEKILSLEPIEGADKIELAKVRGWNVVVQKGLYEVGDLVIYFEIDTMLPQDDERFESFMSRGVRTDSEGRTGHVVKTIRLKGKYSQGLVMPVDEFADPFAYEERPLAVGSDVTDAVGVWKWEPPIPAQLSGKVRGGLPGWVRKTDAERIQNFEDFLPLDPEDFYCTEKIDGSSVTFTFKDDDFHVCSRNLDLEETEGNTFWEIAKKYHIKDFLYDMLHEYCAGNVTPDDYITLQGEIYGEGINGNRLGLKGHHFAAFNFESSKPIWLPYVKDGLVEGIPMVPLFGTDWDYMDDIEDVIIGPRIPAPQSVEEALEAVDGLKSLLAKDRLAEGVVWRRKDGEDIIPGVRSLKAISNKYLLKEK
jgi:RNA ligase (TIGR02306 family)